MEIVSGVILVIYAVAYIDAISNLIVNLYEERYYEKSLRSR